MVAVVQYGLAKEYEKLHFPCRLLASRGSDLPTMTDIAYAAC
jgi:hypothetical protein